MGDNTGGSKDTGYKKQKNNLKTLRKTIDKQKKKVYNISIVRQMTKSLKHRKGVIYMEKLTQARKNEILRERAFDKIIKEGLLGNTLLKVAGSKFMLNVELEGEQYPVRIDFVVPKIDKEDTCQFAEDFAELYEQEQEEKRVAKKEKAKAKEKKIARDKKLREKKKQEEGEQ